MISKIVFDSSALIILFAKEKGYEIVKKYLKYGIISSINVAEVYQYCMEVQDLTENDCHDLLMLSGIKIIDFSKEQALITAKISNQTKQYKLSFQNHACIALAMVKNRQILTQHTAWQEMDLDVGFVIV